MVQLDEKSLETVRAVLRRTPLSRRYKFIIFGSRARGTARPYSDIDIGIISNSPAELRDIGLLDEQFELSNLPFKVEVVDLARTSNDFRRLASQEAQEIRL